MNGEQRLNVLVLCGLTILFTAVATVLAFLHRDTGPAATALIAGVPAALSGLLTLLHGGGPQGPKAV